MTQAEFRAQVISLDASLKLFTRRFTNDRDESLDLVQDTILKALRYQEKFRENTNLKGWLFTIMRNTFINDYRKEKKTRKVNDTTRDMHFLNMAETHTFNTPDANFEYEDIWKNVHEIREEWLIPFKMHASGYKYHEISKHLKLPVGTVKNRIFNARKEIQRKLHGY